MRPRRSWFEGGKAGSTIAFERELGVVHTIKSAASSSRFNYWYSAEELAALKPDVLAISRRAAQVHVLFNTNYQDQGQVNARLMGRQLG
jgi:uncharacterized protein YecE (DUF72 family)